MTTLLAQRYQTVSHFSRPIRVSNKPRFPGNIFDFMRPGKPPYSPLPSVRCLSLSLTDSNPKALRDSLASRRSKIIPPPNQHFTVSVVDDKLSNELDRPILLLSHAYKSFVDYYIYSSNIQFDEFIIINLLVYFCRLSQRWRTRRRHQLWSHTSRRARLSSEVAPCSYSSVIIRN